jgi:hypothetical protein
MKDIENNATTVKLEPVEKSNIVKFIVASALGGFLFLVPIPYGTTFTIPIGTLQDDVHRILGEPSGKLSGFSGEIVSVK